MDISSISAKLVKNPLGIWQTDQIHQVSYPEASNLENFSIEDKSFWFRHRNHCILEAINRFPNRGPVLDIGSGNGYQAGYLQKKGIEMICLEPTPVGAFHAKQRGVTTVINSTFSDCEFNDGSVENFSMFDVLEHIENDRAFLNSLYQALTPDGKLYLTVPAYQFLWSNHDEHVGHFRRYSMSNLRKLLRSEGFEILYDTYFFSYLPPLTLLIRTLPSLVKVRRNKHHLSQQTREHGTNSRFVFNLFMTLSKIELTCLKKLGRLPFGGSCLMVASKPTSK